MTRKQLEKCIRIHLAVYERLPASEKPAIAWNMKRLLASYDGLPLNADTRQPVTNGQRAAND